MQGSVWEAVLRRIPAAKHDSLIVVTTTGVEMVVTKILRLEKDFLLLRARMSGAADLGRIIILPYDQINNVAFNKILPEAEVQAIFGSLDGAANFAETQAVIAPAVDETVGEGEDEEETEEPEAPAPEKTWTPQARPPIPTSSSTPSAAKPSKSILLARLRARLATEPRLP
jgi:hypothetical protein